MLRNHTRRGNAGVTEPHRRESCRCHGTILEGVLRVSRNHTREGIAGVADLAHNLHTLTTRYFLVQYGVISVQMSFPFVRQGLCPWGGGGGHFCSFYHQNLSKKL